MTPQSVLKDTHTENTPSKKLRHLQKVMYIRALNQLFIRGSYIQIKFSKKRSSKRKQAIFCVRPILYSPFNLP